jgi:hypothetical protein
VRARATEQDLEELGRLAARPPQTGNLELDFASLIRAKYGTSPTSAEDHEKP